jgi:hypothetical protein
MIATVLQLLGLVGLTVAGTLEFGVPGLIAGVAVSALYVGAAADT